MPAYLQKAENVIELPCVRGKAALLARLDLFLMDELTASIGFERGTYSLHLAGYKYAADIAASSPKELLGVEGMTEWKLTRIQRFLRRNGLTFGMDVSEWRDYKRRNCDEAERPSQTQRAGLRLVR